MVNQRQHDIITIGIGEILWDLLPAGKQLGGAPANFAYHAQTLGSRGVVVSSVGKDELGQEILTRLKELQIYSGHIAIDREHPTGTVTVELDSRGIPEYTINEDVAWDYIPLSEDLIELAQQADAVCFGSLCQRSEVSRSTIRLFLSATKEGCVRVFDINLRQSFFTGEDIVSLLGICNVLKLNDDELPVVADILGITGDESEILNQLLDRYGLRLIALTRSSQGSRLISEADDQSHPGFAVEVVDTVGAGDSFTAAVVMGLLQDDTLVDINEKANRIASFVCSQNGATPQLNKELFITK